MATVRKYQNNFTTGVLSPAVYSRVDLSKYAAGAKRIVNGIVHVHGGVSNRPGTVMVDELAGPGLIFPFTYSVAQSYILAFYDPDPADPGPHYAKMRVYKDGGVVIDPGTGLAVDVTTPYSPADLQRIKFTQSADTMFLAHPKHPVKKLARLDHHVWTFSDLSFSPTIQPPTWKSGFPSASGFDAEDGSSLYAYYRVTAVDSREVESNPGIEKRVTIRSVWTAGAVVTLKWNSVKGASRYEVYKNVRGYYTWVGSSSKLEFKDDNIQGDRSVGPKEERDPFSPPAIPTGLTLASGTDDQGYVARVRVSSVSVDSQESVASPESTVGVDRTLTEATWNNVPRAALYRLYVKLGDAAQWRYAEVLPSFESLLTTATLASIAEGDWAIGDPPETSKVFYPGAIGIYQQRLVLGRTDLEPQTVWMSESGAFNSFSVATPLRDDSAITATVDSKQMNEIRHFVPLRDVLMFTSGAEFLLSAGRNADAVTPTSISFSLQSYWGSSDVPPVVSGSCIVFVANSGKVVRDLRYQMTDDGYTGEEVSILAEHLLDSPIADWAYQQAPWSTIWVCLESGRLLTFTYLREHEIWAWSEHDSSGGKFLSVSSIREGGADNVYLLTKRGEKYFVEYQKPWEYGKPIQDAFFVDCGLSYDDPDVAISHVTGLDHLAGQAVVALADGSVVRDLVVAGDGSIDLPNAANKIAVGLPYQMIVETLDPEIRAQDGDTVGRRKVVPSVVFTLRETRGLYVGPDENNLVPVKFPLPNEWGGPPELFSGILEVVLPGKHRDEASVVFKQMDPLPMTILSLLTNVGIG